MTTMTATTAALCDKFTKNDGKRGKPARDSVCAVCEVVWTEHFNEKAPERGQQQSVLHPEMVRVIEPPKTKRRPRAVIASVVRKVADSSDDPSHEPEVVEDVEPEVVEIDRMECGHPIEMLSETDGKETCTGCVKRVALWAKMREHWIEQEMARTGKTREGAEAQYERECEDW